MNDKEWKDRLNAKVEGEGLLPAPGVSWDVLEAGMAGIERRRTAWRWAGYIAAAAAMIAGVVFVLPWNRTDANETAPILAGTDIPKVEVVEIIEDVPKSESLLAMAYARPSRKQTRAESEEHSATLIDIGNDGRAVPDECNEEKIPSANHESDQPSEVTQQSDEKTAIGNTIDDNALWAELEREDRRSKSRRGILSIGVGSGFTAGANMNGDYAAPPKDCTNPGGIWSDPTTPSKESITLDFPVSFGLSAKYAFSEKLFVLGGLSATTSHAESSKSLDGELLWYFGPSAGFGVSFYQNVNFSAYTTATGKLDRCVSRRDLPMLPSVNLSAGVQFRLGGVTWLYAEPQLRYTFKSENRTASVSFETLVQFAVSVGLRFDLK